jgi:replicative DNA helicase
VRLRTLLEQVADLKDYSQNPLQRVRTGLAPIDALCGGPAPGEVFMVVGRSFTGKSILAQNIIFNNRKVPSIFFSLEMPYIQAVQRLYSIWSDTPNSSVNEMVESGTLPDVLDYMAQDFPAHIIDDQEGANLNYMSSFISEYDSFYGYRPEFVVIDYLELLGGSKKSGEGWIATEQQATSLKDWAKAEEMRVFVLHQANKQEPDWEPPTSNSPRGGGYTEADFVVGMWQPGLDPDLMDREKEALRGVVHFNVLKNRAFGNTSLFRDIRYQIAPSLIMKEMQ